MLIRNCERPHQLGEQKLTCPLQTSEDVLERPSDLFVRRGVPGHIRSDNGPEFTANAVREWPGRVGVTAPHIEPGSPWENGYIESFNGKLSDELPDGEVFDTLPEAKILIERWRVPYDTVRPHSSPGYRPPAPEAIVPRTPAFAAALSGPAAMAGVVGALTSQVVSTAGAGQVSWEGQYCGRFPARHRNR
jgi:hypothetical protein